jgi:hypothetical protein
MAFQIVSWSIVWLTTLAAYGRFIGTLRGFWGLSPSWSAEAFGALWCFTVATWGTCGALQRATLRRQQLLGAALALALCTLGLAALVGTGVSATWTNALRDAGPHAAVQAALPAIALLVWTGAVTRGAPAERSVRTALASQAAGLGLFFLPVTRAAELPIVWLLVVMPALLYARSCAYQLMARPAGWRLRAYLGLIAALLSSVPAL